MRKSWIWMSCAAVLCGVSLSSAYGQSANELAELRQENVRLRLAFSETEKGFQEQYEKIVAHVNSLQDIIVKMQATVNECKKKTIDDGGKTQNQAEVLALRQQVQTLQADNAQLREEIKVALTKLQRLIEAEARQRQAGMQKLVDVISSGAARTAAPARAAAPAPAPAAPEADNSSEEYYEYVVQKGATLSAIAKAYKVSMDDIRRANKLSRNSSLRVGQKLLIPKK